MGGIGLRGLVFLAIPINVGARVEVDHLRVVPRHPTKQITGLVGPVTGLCFAW
jgi:hypothetical protein